MKNAKILFLINPASGTQRRKNIAEIAKKTLGDMAHVEIAYTEYAGHATELARKAVLDGFDTVVAVGGDGTINETAKFLVESGVALYVIPMGSGNGLARVLGISLEPQKAIEQLIHSEIKLIDTGLVNKKLFLGTTGVGFEAQVSHAFAKEKSRGLKTYIKSSIQNFLKYQPQGYSIKVDQAEEREVEAFMLTVANISQFGNDFFIAPNADPTDGYLDLCLLKPFKSYEAPFLAFQSSQKKIHQNPNMEIIRAKKVEITRKNASETIAQLDGEPAELPQNITVEIRPKSLKVRVPKK